MVWPNNVVDWCFFALRFRWVVLVSLGVAALNIGVYLACRYSLRSIPVLLKFTPMFLALVYLMVTVSVRGRDELLLTMLGSEEDDLAERAYDASAKVFSADRILHLLQDPREDDNVRFYLARMLGEQMSSFHLDTARIKTLLTNAPPLNPRFIGQNRFTSDLAAFALPTTPIEVVRHYERRQDRNDRNGVSSENSVDGVTAEPRKQWDQ